MPDDLVKELRASYDPNDAVPMQVCLDAADRIERLEAALRFYACDCKPDDGCGVEYYDGGAYCGYTARTALNAE